MNKFIKHIIVFIVLFNCFNFYVDARDNNSFVVEPDIISGNIYCTLRDEFLTVYALDGKIHSDGDFLNVLYKYYGSFNKIVLSDTITFIGSQSFDGLTYPVTLYFSKTISQIDGYAFARCSNLMIEIDDTNPYFKIVDGILYTQDMTKLVYASPLLTGDFTVPESVTTICDGAFCYSNFENITVGDNVIDMMSPAYTDFPEDDEWCGKPFGRVFANALSKNITIGKNVKMLGRCSVFRCPNLKSLTILGKDTEFEDDFVIDDEGSFVDVIYVPHSSYAEEYMKTYYNGYWEYLSIDDSNDILTTTTVESAETYYQFKITPKIQLTTELLLVALYDGNKFVSVNKVEYTNDGISPVVVLKNTNITNVKVFLWNNIEQLSPIGSAENIVIP